MSDRPGFDPSEVYVYGGKGSVPKTVGRAEVDRSVKFIPDRLFERCDQLESVPLHEGLRKVGEGAFQGCSSLRKFRCPSTVAEIGWAAFRDCSSLAEVELPDGLETIDDETFSGCTSLEDINVPASVDQINHGAFLGCANLSSVGLREGLHIIGDQAFDECRSLESLCVPHSVVEIGMWAFDGCSGLSLVLLHEDLPATKRFAFGGCTSLERFEFIHLTERMKTMRMDEQTKSMFDSRLGEITLASKRADHDMSFWSEEKEEEEAEAVRDKCKKSLGRAHEVLTYLELKGAAPVLELALWKAKIEGQGVQGKGGQDLSDAGRERKRPKVTTNTGQDTRLSRGDCRVKCGASIVLPEVLKHFTYSSSWPRLGDAEEGNVD